MGKRGVPQSMGSQRVRHDGATKQQQNMESRKLVVMNVFAGQQWRRRHREQACGRGRRGRKRV